MDHQDEEVANEEPQLRYWNPWRRSRSVFTASSMPPAPLQCPPVNPLQFVKLGPQVTSFCDSRIYSCVRPSIYDSQQVINQELPLHSDFQNPCELSNEQLPQTSSETTLTGLNSLINLDSVTSQSPSFLLSRQGEDQKFFIKQEPEEELDDKLCQDLNDDIVTFNSIDEALDSIDPPSTPDSNRSSASINSLQGNGNKMGLTNEKHEEVVKAAKSLFSKRTRTLYHWLFPDTSKNKLKATVSAAWETLSEGEKHFYISQVLGRFGLQASSLMVNPQLGGMKCLPNEAENKGDKKKVGPIEDQRAVDSLFDSCEDAGNWASYSEPKPATKPKPERKRRRKKQKEQDQSSSDPDLEQEMKNLKKLKRVQKELEDFEEDSELTKELEKFRLITEAAEEDIWGDIPDPEELFAEIDF